jgi:thiol-disulfide isomerase/thioredoxin
MQLIKQLARSLGIMTGVTLLTASSLGAGIKAGDTFPSLATFRLEGTLPETLKDKVVMIDFWASWCEPCKESFPTMNDLQKQFGPAGLVVIAVNVDEKKADMEDFLKKHAASFTVVRDATQKLVDKASIATMPTSFLIDREGKVRFVHSGYRGDETKKKYVQEIESILKK